jgi:hypothetical protein
MQSQELKPERSGAPVCPVDNSVGLFPCSDRRNGYLAVKRDGIWLRLCPWCETPLQKSTRKPFKFCSEAHEKAFKRSGCISKKEREAQRAEDEKLEQLAIDYWLHFYNRNRAFSTFGKHDPLDKLPSFSVKRGKDRKQQFSRCLHCRTEFVDGQGRPVVSGFAFCGETLLVAGECKKAWLAWVNDSVSKPTGPVPEPCPVLPAFRPSLPEVQPFIGPLLRNGRRKRGRA